MNFYALLITIHYVTRINGQEWRGSNVGTSPTLYIDATSEAEAIRKIQNSRLLPKVGAEYGVGGEVESINVSATLVNGFELV